MQTFVITGATSFIGLELIRYLLKHHHKVIAVCRRNSHKLSLIPVNTEVICAEMQEYNELYKKKNHADVFINLAWEGTGHDGRNVKNIQKTNISHTIKAMHTANKMGCKVFVEAGSQAEYGIVNESITENTPCNPISEYGKAKLETQKKLFSLSELLDIKYIHLRIFSLFGENDHPWTLVMSCINKMLRNEPIELSNCTQKWNFLYVKDAVCQIVDLCEYATNNPDYRHEIYNIASKDTRILKDFVEEMKELTSSTSELHFGTINPTNIVSLNPNITKMENAIGELHFTPFQDVVNNIIWKYKH